MNTFRTLTLVAFVGLIAGSVHGQETKSPSKDQKTGGDHSKRTHPIDTSDTGGPRGFYLSLRGKVLDENGQSIAGATVTLISANDPAKVYRAKTDGAGLYEVKKVDPAQTYVLQLEHPGYRTLHASEFHVPLEALPSQVLVMTPGSEDQSLELTLATIHGKIKYPDGRPAARVAVSLAGVKGPPAVSSTGNDGEFTFTNLPSGSYTLSYGKTHTTIHVPEDNEVELNLSSDQ
jgi:hypothetical protein